MATDLKSVAARWKRRVFCPERSRRATLRKKLARSARVEAQGFSPAKKIGPKGRTYALLHPQQVVELLSFFEPTSNA